MLWIINRCVAPVQSLAAEMEIWWDHGDVHNAITSANCYHFTDKGHAIWQESGIGSKYYVYIQNSTECQACSSAGPCGRLRG
jgi:hypothetical protein